MSDPHSYETIRRCSVCGISWTKDCKAEWCRMQSCPNTDQRVPSDEQIAKYKINEPFVVTR